MKKRLLLLFIFIYLFILLAACSSKPPVELIHSTVELKNDKSHLGSMTIMNGERKGEEVIPTALYYSIRLKNTSWNELGEEDPKNKVTVKIIPSEKLIEASREIIGFNIFNSDEYVDSGVGFGESIDGIIPKGKTGKYDIYYELGVQDANQSEFKVAPSREAMGELLKISSDATVVVYEGKKEVARFNLNK
ncbi:hypothetical protein [Peribacillus frigoritolerans]|uniref:hypothetical protein n=1 Tax=Peribacillus frigoritolerans TaxID=450367 RepID=UPI00105AAA25|nr:hypothetical protein [Peribacillus frigoritolerans]TDL76147.1 hypothetical protein E2R53_20845 [Peribacillus frigoritolerans]